MKKLENNELLNKLRSSVFWNDIDAEMDYTSELLSRLERGRKAIEAMENIRLCISVLNDFNVKYKMNDIIEIFGNYQQSCKKSADGD